MQFGTHTPMDERAGNEGGPVWLFVFDNGFAGSVAQVTQEQLDAYPREIEPDEVGTYEFCTCAVVEGFGAIPLRMMGLEEGPVGSAFQIRLDEAGVTELLDKLQAWTKEESAA